VTDATEPADGGAVANKTLVQRMLDGIERVGNKMPNPAVLFLLLCVLTVVLSQGAVLVQRPRDV